MATYTEDQLEQYFQHIDFPTSSHPKQPLRLLADLQKFHVSRIPFDSIALHYSPHRVLSLDPQDLFEKIVLNSRGGYCVELNTLFGTVLRSLGFVFIPVGARVKHERWDHMVNLVTVEGKRYLVDVGFGAKEPTQPVPLESGFEFTGIAPLQGRIEWKSLPRHSDPEQRVWVYSARDDADAKWEDLYSFTETEYFPEDFEMMSYFMSTRPQSYFVQTVLAMRMILDPKTQEMVGELILHRNYVKRRIGDKTETVEVMETEEQRIHALKSYFWISLTLREQKAIKGLASELKSR